jgi:hypothetical protein
MDKLIITHAEILSRAVGAAAVGPATAAPTFGVEIKINDQQ